MWGDLLDLDWLGGLSDADFSDLGDLGSLGGDFGELGDLGDVDWSALTDLADYDFGGELGDMVLDTYTGEFVNVADLDPAEITDLDLSGSGAGPVGDQPFAGSLDDSTVSRSISDRLRSAEADPNTPGTEQFDRNLMADPSASIASAEAENSDWAKTLAKGLSGLFSGAGKALTGLGDRDGGGSGIGAGGGGQMGEQLMRRMPSPSLGVSQIIRTGGDSSGPRYAASGGDPGARLVSTAGDRIGSSPAFSSGRDLGPTPYFAAGRNTGPAAPLLSGGGGRPDAVFSSGAGSALGGLADLIHARAPATPAMQGDPLTNFHAAAGPAPTREAPSALLDAALAKFIPLIMQQQPQMSPMSGPSPAALSGIERLLRESRG